MTTPGFRHDALMYRGPDDFVPSVQAFIQGSLVAGDPIQVMVIPEKIDRLREALGADAHRVRFADMSEIGRNPNRIIPAWQEFFEEAGGHYGRGIGEPVWASRSADEIAESERHEALINVAFRRARGWILCPYDADTLDPSVIESALQTHPGVAEHGSSRPSVSYLELTHITQPFDAPLEEPSGSWDGMRFDAQTGLDTVRAFAEAHARNAGFADERTTEIVLTLSELTTNSLRHAGGEGSIRAWQTTRALVIEVRDEGRILDAMAGRVKPLPANEGGYGLWIVNQLADLAQVRTFESGTVVRVHFAR